MKNNSRKKAVHALLLVNRLKEIIEKIDRGSDIEHFFDSIENTTIKLGNTIKEIAKKNRTLFDKKTEATLYNLRCEFAHQTGSENYNHKEGYNLWEKKIHMALPSLEKNLSKIASKPSERPEKKEFESRTSGTLGDSETRKRIVDALEDSFENRPNGETCKYPKGSEIVKQTADEFDEEYKKYLSKHEELSENVQSDILDWSEQTKDDIEYESLRYFAKEKQFIDIISELPPIEFFKNIDQFEKAYNNIESVVDHFDMHSYQKSCQDDIKKLSNTKDKKKQESLIRKSYFHALTKTLQRSFNTRKAEFEQKLIDERRKIFLEELYKKIENFKKLEKILTPFITDLGHGYLWDLSSSPFRNLGFDILEKYSILLNNDKALIEFAELLGRQSVTSKEVEKRIIEEISIKSSYIPKAAQCGNVVGFDYSNEISRVVPVEKSLMKDPDLEDLFFLKFAEKQLLSYRYSKNDKYTYDEKHTKEIEKSKAKDITGPIIICVDTSGSMHGTPEQTAKVATLAIAKSAFKHHRKCFLISFSTGIETLDLSDFNKMDALDCLVEFLNKSFHGGTDASPALKECLNQLKTENYKNADVLMISDFVMSHPPQDIVSSIEDEQKNGTFFYSIVIGNSANNSAIECFDENINYDPYDEKSRQEFYKKVRAMSISKKRNGKSTDNAQL